MTDRPLWSAPRWMLPALGVVLAGAIASSMLWTRPTGDRDGLPPDCGATPAAYHPGTIVDWPGADATLPNTRRPDNAALFARVRFDTGRMALAYNATPDLPKAGSRVVVAEIRCVNRTIYLLTEFGAPAAADDVARPPPKAH